MNLPAPQQATVPKALQKRKTRTRAPSSLQKIRLSSDWANPLKRESEWMGGW